MSSPNPIRFWCYPCDGRRATCPSCGARVRPRGDQAAIWNCGSVGQAIAADKGIILQDDDLLTESLLLADWLDEHGHSPEADAIRVRVNLVNQGKRLLYDPLEP